MASPLEHKSTTIDTVSWTPIVVPFPCNSVTLLNQSGANIKVRTNSADATTEITIVNNSNYNVVVPRSQKDVSGPLGYRFTGTVLVAQAVSGTGPLIMIAVV